MNRAKSVLRAIAFAFIALGVSSPLPALTEIWLSATGRDDAAGTHAAPFATFFRARDALRKVVSAGLKDDVVIRLRAGVYRLDAPFEFTGGDLGDGTFRVTVEGEHGSRVVLLGSRELSGTWRRIEGDLWSMPLPAAGNGGWLFRCLFRAEKSLPRAREPDAGWFTVAGVEDERRRLRLNETLPAAWRGLQGAEVNSIAHWHFNRQPVAEISENGVQGRRPIGADASSARINEKSHSRVWLENALAFVDMPGEWFLDAGKGELYYRAAPGEDPNASRFSAPVARELMIFRGTVEKPVRNVHVRGIEFAETDWEMPAEGRLGLQAGAWSIDRSRTYSPGAALRFIYTLVSSVRGCTFRELGDGAIAFEIGCSDALVNRCEFRRVGSNPIQIGRMPEYTGDRHPLHRDFARSEDWLAELKSLPNSEEMWRQASATIVEAPARVEISDNTLLDCGHLDYGCVGIWVGYANHVRIEHNLIRNLPYSGISVGWRWAPGLSNCHSNVIVRNRIESVMQQAGDGAGIYLMGEQPGTRILDNYINDSGRNYWSHGLYGDEKADHMEFAGNYVTRAMDHSIFMNKNGPNQLLRDNNGENGPTAITGGNLRGGKWVDFKPERGPEDPSRYGPRNGPRSASRQ